MDFSRYEKLRTLVRANFSEQTRRTRRRGAGVCRRETRRTGALRRLAPAGARRRGGFDRDLGGGPGPQLHHLGDPARRGAPRPQAAARRRVPRPERRHPQTLRRSGRGHHAGSGQHLGAEAQGGQGAGRQLPRPDRQLLRRPARDPHQTGRPPRSDALARDVPPRKVAQEELGVDEPLRPDRPQAGPLLDQERAGGHRPEIPRTEGLRARRHKARRERRGAQVPSSAGSSCRSSSG